MKHKYAIPTLFTLTAFFGASLIFMVQPLISKLLLPSYGGSAAVWTTSSFFFQVLLLVGYILVHGTVRLGKKQVFVFVGLAVLALAMLPLVLPADASPAGHSPFLWLVKNLAVIVGIPYLLLATTGPLIQKWYSWTGAVRSDDPYFIYAASNVGSFLGLLAYPFVIEPNLAVDGQRALWTGCFIAYIVLMLACAATLRRPAAVALSVNEKPAGKLSGKTQLWWIFLAFVPSSLMLGVTTNITTDVAPIPLLWVVPLALYLATMIFAFARTSRKVNPAWPLAVFLVAPVTIFLSLNSIGLNIYLLVGLLLTSMTLIALVCHMMLSATRPEVAHLTRYYVLVSLGGALGGAFNSLVAPLLFPAVWEFGVVLALAILVAVRVGPLRWSALALAFITLAAYLSNDLMNQDYTVERDRTFYGSYAVVDDVYKKGFVHGTTTHGLQTKKSPLEPTSYYHKDGPLGSVFKASDYSTVTAVGMGVGTIAAYGVKGQTLKFVEIDSLVTKLAKKHFTYLEDSKADIEIIEKDGRLAVQELDKGTQELIILDAFSSDSIPMHLLTEEAMKIYQSKLTDDGILAVHISNRVFDLVPVVYSHAEALGMAPLYKITPGEEATADSFATTWMVLAPEGERKEALLKDGWRDLSTDSKVDVKPIRWTDDYSSILDILM